MKGISICFSYCKVRNLGEAIQSLKDVQVYLDSKGIIEEAAVVASTADSLASLHCKNLLSARQSTMDEFL